MPSEFALFGYIGPREGCLGKSSCEFLHICSRRYLKGTHSPSGLLTSRWTLTASRQQPDCAYSHTRCEIREASRQEVINVVKQLSRNQFESFDHAERPPIFHLMVEGRQWYADDVENILGVLTWVETDKDRPYAMLGSDAKSVFRWIEKDHSFERGDCHRSTAQGNGLGCCVGPRDAPLTMSSWTSCSAPHPLHSVTAMPRSTSMRLAGRYTQETLHDDRLR